MGLGSQMTIRDMGRIDVIELNMALHRYELSRLSPAITHRTKIKVYKNQHESAITENARKNTKQKTNRNDKWLKCVGPNKVSIISPAS